MTTLIQAKRVVRIVAGFALLAIGIILLALPGPGALTIALGLGLLAAEFVWARRLLNWLKNGVAGLVKRRHSGKPGASRPDAEHVD